MEAEREGAVNMAEGKIGRQSNSSLLLVRTTKSDHPPQQSLNRPCLDS